MTWGIFIPQFPEDHRLALEAMVEGLKAKGIDHLVTGMNYEDCGVAVVFGIGKEAVPASWARGKIIEKQKNLGRRVLIIEKGFIKRDQYFHVGWDGLNGRADFCNDQMPSDRWAKLDVHLKNWQVDDLSKPVVICGQVPWDASVQHSDHMKWCQETVAMLRAMTHRKLIFRPHPMVQGKVDYEIGGVEISHRPLEEDLQRAHAVITFNSNSAVEAVIQGVPVFVADKGTMAGDVANWELSDIEHPKKPPRQKWASNLAYAQWNLEEIAAGEPVEHLT